jgi:hypothetical protein
MSWHGTAMARQGDRSGRTRSHALVALVSRMLVAQAGASAAVSLSYSRRHGPSVLLLHPCRRCALRSGRAGAIWQSRSVAGRCHIRIWVHRRRPFPLRVRPIPGRCVAGGGRARDSAPARAGQGLRRLPQVPDRVGLGGPVLGEGPGELVAGQAVSLFGPFKPAGHMLGMGAGVWSPWSSLRF